MKKFLLGLSILFLVVLLAACNKEDDNNNGFEREDVQITHTITSGGLLNEAGTGWAGGTRGVVTHTFKTNPQNVVIFNFDILDMLDVAGIDKTSISKLAIPKGNVPGYLAKYDSSDYISAGSLFVPDYKNLDLLLPDLIVIGGRSAGSYDVMKELYPYADILDVGIEYGDYMEGVTNNALNLGKIFPSIKADLDREVATLQSGMDEIKEVAKDYKALFVMMNGEAFSFFQPNGRFAAIHDEFGFDIADPEYGNQDSSHGNLGSHEYVRSVDPEIIFIMDRSAATGGTSSNLDAFLNNGLIKDTIAGKNDDIYSLDPTTWYISVGGINSTRQMVEDFQNFLTKYKPSSS